MASSSTNYAPALMPESPKHFQKTPLANKTRLLTSTFHLLHTSHGTTTSTKTDHKTAHYCYRIEHKTDFDLLILETANGKDYWIPVSHKRNRNKNRHQIIRDLKKLPNPLVLCLFSSTWAESSLNNESFGSFSSPAFCYILQRFRKWTISFSSG